MTAEKQSAKLAAPITDEAWLEKVEKEQRLTSQVISAKEMATKEYPDQSFLIGPALLPRGGRLLLTGTTGLGKSAVAMHICACLTTSKPLFDLKHKRHDANQGKPVFPVNGRNKVLYVDYEVPENLREKNRLKPLEQTFGSEFREGLFFALTASSYKLENIDGRDKGLDRLTELVSDMRPDVLVIDPLSSTHTLNENSNEIKQPLNNLDRIIADTKTSVILVHHASSKVPRTSDGAKIVKDAIEQPRGHTSIPDWTDAHICLEELKLPGARIADRVKKVRLSFGKSRHGALPHPKDLQVDIGNMTFTEWIEGEDEDD